MIPDVNNESCAAPFAARRKRFAEAIGTGAVAILPAAPVAVRSRDVEYVYRQDSDFYYLTGFAEPEAVAVIAPGHPDGEFVLFVLPRDRERETWTGRRAGVEGAVAEGGADRAYSVEELERRLPGYLQDAQRLFYPLGVNPKVEARVLEILRQVSIGRERTGTGPAGINDPREFLHEARLFKSAEELAAMRRACDIAAQAHRRAMSAARDQMGEWEIEALFSYTFRSLGAAGPSYPSIVASGPNATILHYVNNDRRISRGELLLIDAGCEYEFYASDVTRTFPVAARFSQLQRNLYDAVLAAQLKGIETVRPGARVDDVHEATLRVLVEGMHELGLVAGTVDEILEKQLYRPYYMHRTGHWLGMDVHDVGVYRIEGQSRRLEPGMVITVEPGIYISADAAEAPEAMRGIGIRIEDDVLVTEQGHEVLTAATPKLPEEIETLTASA